jgi:uncharacterized protein (DUF362 family)
VAISAQQDALRGLPASELDRPRHAGVTQAEVLRGRIDVVELQGPNEAVVAAQAAGSSGLFDEQGLNAAPAPGYVG